MENEENYDVYELSLNNMNISYSLDNKNLDSQKDNIINYIKSLKLEEKGYYGLQESMIEDINRDIENGTQVESYKFYIPKGNKNIVNRTMLRTGTNDDVYYGSYDGYKFRAAFTLKRVRWSSEIKDDASDIKNWVKGAVLIRLGMKTSPWVWIPASIFDIALGNGSVQYDDSELRITPKGDLTSRFIMINDKLGKEGLPDNSRYVTVYMDQAAQVRFRLDLTLPGAFTEGYSKYTDYEEFYTKYFYKRTNTMDRAMKHYIMLDVGDIRVSKDYLATPRYDFKKK